MRAHSVKMRATSTSSAGFTLIEVMIVSAIIIVLAAAAVPNIMGSQINRELVDATNGTMSMVQFAKNRAVNDFRAYGLVIELTEGADEGGLVSVIRGTGPNCQSVDLGTDPMKVYDVNSVYRGAEGVTIRLLGTLPDDLTLVCFTPDGRMVDADSGRPIQGGGAAGEFRLSLQKFIGDAPATFLHNVVVPYSGNPRWTFGTEITDDEGATGGQLE